MSFSYGFGSNPPIDYPRLLISDTTDTGHIFEDSEIIAATLIEQSVWQSSMFYSGSAGANVPTVPVSYRRIAATLLDSLASNKARLSSVTQLLDVKLSPEKASQELRAQAKVFRDTEDENGAFVMIEQVNDCWSFRDRFWKQWQRTAST